MENECISGEVKQTHQKDDSDGFNATHPYRIESLAEYSTRCTTTLNRLAYVKYSVVQQSHGLEATTGKHNLRQVIDESANHKHHYNHSMKQRKESFAHATDLMPLPVTAS